MRAWKKVDNPARFLEGQFDYREFPDKDGNMVLHASRKQGAQIQTAPLEGIEFTEELPQVCPAVKKNGTICGKAPKNDSKWCGTHLRKRRRDG